MQSKRKIKSLENFEDILNAKFISLITLTLLALSITACQSKPKPHVDKSVEYEDARSIPPLRIPEK